MLIRKSILRTQKEMLTSSSDNEKWNYICISCRKGEKQQAKKSILKL